MNSHSHSTFVGIDVAKHSLDVATNHARDVRQFIDDEHGLEQLITYLRTLSPALIVMEATGGLERRLLHHLITAGFAVSVVNPRQIRDFARAFNQLAKTDAIDARVIACFAEVVQPRTCELPEQYAQKLQQIGRAQCRVRRAIAKPTDPFQTIVNDGVRQGISVGPLALRVVAISVGRPSVAASNRPLAAKRAARLQRLSKQLLH